MPFLFFLLIILAYTNSLYTLHQPALNIPSNKNIAVFSIQKCGTHLLTKCIELLTGYKPMPYRKTDVIKTGDLPALQKNTFIHAHAPYTQEAAQALDEHKYKAVFIYRDPRDQIVSMAHWIAEKSYKSAYYKADPNSNTYITDLITELIPKTYRKYTRFMPWISDPLTLSVSFEQLIGSKGGGNDQLQAQTIKHIAQHLNYPVSSDKLNYCIRNLFGDSPTFRKGLVGRWREFFSQDQKQLCKKHLGKLLIDLGYEKNLDW